MIGCIVVAAGYGSLREEGGRPVPKVIEKVSGIPMIGRALRAAERSGIQDIVVVTNPRDQDVVLDAITYSMRGGSVRCMPSIVIQPERRGSAEAVLHAIPVLQSHGCDRALITYADMPMWSSSTFRILCAQSHNHHVVTMTTVLRDPDYPVLERYGRVLRDHDGNITQVMEVNDPRITPEILAIERVNPSLWVWNLKWLRKNIPLIRPFRKTDGYHDELYMPPLIEMASSQGLRINELDLSIPASKEAVGVNTLEELHELNTNSFA